MQPDPKVFGDQAGPPRRSSEAGRLLCRSLSRPVLAVAAAAAYCYYCCCYCYYLLLLLVLLSLLLLLLLYCVDAPPLALRPRMRQHDSLRDCHLSVAADSYHIIIIVLYNRLLLLYCHDSLQASRDAAPAGPRTIPKHIIIVIIM